MSRGCWTRWKSNSCSVKQTKNTFIIFSRIIVVILLKTIFSFSNFQDNHVNYIMGVSHIIRFHYVISFDKSNKILCSRWKRIIIRRSDSFAWNLWHCQRKTQAGNPGSLTMRLHWAKKKKKRNQFYAKIEMKCVSRLLCIVLHARNVQIPSYTLPCNSSLTWDAN